MLRVRCSNVLSRCLKMVSVCASNLQARMTAQVLVRKGQEVTHTIVIVDGVATASNGNVSGKSSQHILSAVLRLLRCVNTVLRL